MVMVLTGLGLLLNALLLPRGGVGGWSGKRSFPPVRLFALRLIEQ